MECSIRNTGPMVPTHTDLAMRSAPGLLQCRGEGRVFADVGVVDRSSGVLHSFLKMCAGDARDRIHLVLLHGIRVLGLAPLPLDVLLDCFPDRGTQTAVVMTASTHNISARRCLVDNMSARRCLVDNMSTQLEGRAISLRHKAEVRRALV
jgi:hypothetical protein